MQQGDVRLDGGADGRRAHPPFAQSDRQILGLVWINQGYLAGCLLGHLFLDLGQICWIALGPGLELLLKHVHVQFLEQEPVKTVREIIWTRCTWEMERS